MKIAIIGIGLIGGSIALVLKRKGFASYVVGVDSSHDNSDKAISLGLVDEVATLERAIANCDLIILAVPVDACVELLPRILDGITRQVVLDVGSTKIAVTAAVAGHVNRRRYVACHPMWGTEFSGPEAATEAAFSGRANVICNSDESDNDAMELTLSMFTVLGMYPVYMTAQEHDLHVAYVSHIAHITSFALANTVLQKEREEHAIFELASAGFESTVRLAKSSPAMWGPILQQNKDHVLDVLNEHIAQLRKFKSCLEKENWTYLAELMEHANKITRVLDGSNRKQRPAT